MTIRKSTALALATGVSLVLGSIVTLRGTDGAPASMPGAGEEALAGQLHNGTDSVRFQGSGLPQSAHQQPRHGDAEADDGLIARNHWHDMESYAAASEARDAAEDTPDTHLSVASGASEPTVDLVFAFHDRAQLAGLRAQVEALGGEMTREYTALPMGAVRLPASMVDQLNVKAVTAVPDSEVRFLSSAARATANVPLAGSPLDVAAESDIVVAVLDSGVANHPDINLVGRVNVIRPASVQASPGRIDTGLQALYLFDEGDGATIFDRADVDGEPVDLALPDDSDHTWQGEQLSFDNDASATADAGRINSACALADSIAVEAWITPANATQAGPARIVAQGDADRNFALSQNGDRFEFRLRTTDNGLDGATVVLQSPPHSVGATLQHVVVTRDAAGVGTMYIDGLEVAQATIPGALSNWDPDYGLSIGSTDSATGWAGSFAMLAVHCAELSGADVTANFTAGERSWVTDYDPLGHGTHVAGIVGGDATLSLGSYPGMAPGASVYDVRVLRADGRGNVSDVIAGLDWVIANHAAHNIRVVNMSLGKAVETEAALDPLVIAAEAAWDAGVVVVASAGNYGDLGYFHITSPGNSPKLITVGSITDNSTALISTDDYVSSYSSRGPTGIDHYMKPDLLAPGNRFIAPISDNAYFKDALPPGAVPVCGGACDGSYLEMSGTSMAAGVVSGTAALMLSQDSDLNPATVKARLMRSARKIDADPVVSGAGVLDVSAALSETGMVAAAPSPRMVPSADGSGVMIEDTADLWGGVEWSAANLWHSGDAWSTDAASADSYLWSDSYLWNDSYLWSDSYLWNDSYLWSDSYLWNDSYLWSDSILEGDSESDVIL